MKATVKEKALEKVEFEAFGIVEVEALKVTKVVVSKAKEQENPKQQQEFVTTVTSMKLSSTV